MPKMETKYLLQHCALFMMPCIFTYRGLSNSQKHGLIPKLSMFKGINIFRNVMQ